VRNLITKMSFLLVMILAMLITSPADAQAEFTFDELKEIEFKAHRCRESYVESDCDLLAKFIAKNPDTEARLKRLCEPDWRAFKDYLFRSFEDKLKNPQLSFPACETELLLSSALRSLDSWKTEGEGNPDAPYSNANMDRYTKQCAKGDGKACWESAIGYRERENRVERLNALVKACQEGFDGSLFKVNPCQDATSLLADAETVQINNLLEPLAVAYCKRDEKGCIKWANRLREKRARVGLAFTMHGCAVGEVQKLCALGGAMYVKGEGTERDLKKGMNLLHNSCLDEPSELACFFYGSVVAKIHKQAPQPPELLAQARNILSKSCDLGHVQSCSLRETLK